MVVDFGGSASCLKVVATFRNVEAGNVEEARLVSTRLVVLVVLLLI